MIEEDGGCGAGRKRVRKMGRREGGGRVGGKE